MNKTPGIERFSLSGRVVLVTGSTRGLGLAIARGMAAAGAVVGINGRDPARAGEVANSIPNAFPAPFDITDPIAGAAAMGAIVARHDRLDCLVNNAAVRDRRPLEEIAAEDFRRLIETNLVAQYELSRVAARHMAARGQGRLVFVSSFFSQPRVVELARRIPLQRFGRPDELVGAAIFLASDAASYVTGQVLTVDAGLSVAL